jgi:SPX domain protein involved in polyphosphate accumulation
VSTNAHSGAPRARATTDSRLPRTVFAQSQREAKLHQEVAAAVAGLSLAPVLSTTYARSAFQLDGDDRLRIRYVQRGRMPSPQR